MLRNFSLGAHMATVDRPPTMPAVYQAALIISGPPRRVRGAMTAPITPSRGNTTHCDATFIHFTDRSRRKQNPVADEIFFQTCVEHPGEVFGHRAVLI